MTVSEKPLLWLAAAWLAVLIAAFFFLRWIDASWGAFVLWGLVAFALVPSGFRGAINDRKARSGETAPIKEPCSGEPFPAEAAQFALTTALWIATICIAIVLWFLYLRALLDWIGGWGIPVAIVTAPGILVFPLIHWLVEDAWPVTYLWLYGAGIGIRVLAASLGSR